MKHFGLRVSGETCAGALYALWLLNGLLSRKIDLNGKTCIQSEACLWTS